MPAKEFGELQPKYVLTFSLSLAQALALMSQLQIMLHVLRER